MPRVRRIGAGAVGAEGDPEQLVALRRTAGEFGRRAGDRTYRTTVRLGQQVAVSGQQSVEVGQSVLSIAQGHRRDGVARHLAQHRRRCVGADQVERVGAGAGRHRQHHGLDRDRLDGAGVGGERGLVAALHGA
jgi:hypothetical protein